MQNPVFSQAIKIDTSAHKGAIQQNSSIKTSRNYSITFALEQNRYVHLRSTDLELTHALRFLHDQNMDNKQIDQLDMSRSIHPADLPFFLVNIVNSKHRGINVHTNVRIKTKKHGYQWVAINALFNRESNLWHGTLQYNLDQNNIDEKHDRNNIYQEIIREERKQISSRLHDGVGQELVLMNLLISQIENSENQPQIEQIRSILQNSISDVRKLSYDLNIPDPDTSIEKILKRLESNYNELESFSVNTKLSPKIKKDRTCAEKLYHVQYILQEFCSNSIKYSGGNRVDINISKVGMNHAKFEIQDNGNGFDFDEKLGNGMGLKNIMMRLKMVAETSSFHSNDRGTVLSFVVGNTSQHK